jgi:glyoxylase-like metal-dependent hydrolase (beta-lactamase superfamily II)
VALDVHRISIPTPYAVGPVNAYLIQGSPLTLVDCGINTDPGREALLQGLAAAGHEPADIERILITHAHPDHYGLAYLLQDGSDATVFFPEREIARVRDRQMLFEVGRLLMEAGMPLELLFKMDQARKSDPTRPKMKHDEVVLVHDGDRFSFADGPDLVALHMPGHTGGHMVYLDESDGVLFAGDQLLPDVTPNPLLEPSLDEPGERRRSLSEYLDSLERMGAMELALAYPGHGDPVKDPGELIARTIEHHLKRKAEVGALLGPEPKTPYEIASEVYPEVAGYDSFLAVSEVIAHLDLVIEDGDGTTEEREGVIYYRSG